MHENMNVFEGNQDYFHPFIDPERLRVNMDSPVIFLLPDKFLQMEALK